MGKPAIFVFAYATLLVAGVFILRFVVRRGYRDRGRLTPLPGVLQALVFFCYGGFPALYLTTDWPAVHVNPVQHMLGLCLLYGGLGMLLYGIYQLGLLRSFGMGEPGLTRSGLYRSTRNPQALACASYILGFTLLWPSWQAVFWAALYAILIRAMVVTEEEHLQRIHGHSFDAYCREVPRYFSLRPARSRLSSNSQSQLKQ